MRILLIALLFISFESFGQSKLYDLNVRSSDSSEISFKNYQGKKLLIATVSMENLEKDKLQLLESIQNEWPSIQIIVVPSQENISERDSVISSMIKSRESKLVFTTQSYVTKEKASEQNELVKYLTDVKANTHFDNDASADFQLFIVSESGILYAVLADPVNLKTLDEILRQEDVKQ